MFQFELPYAFFMLPLPVLVYFLIPQHRESGIAVKVPFISRLAQTTGKNPRKGDTVLLKNLLQKILFVLCWCVLVIALARPVEILPPIEQTKSGRDLLLLVDLSGSMATSDFTDENGDTISRLEAVKNVIYDFVEHRVNDRIGLAIFGNAAFPQVPFTLDHSLLNTLLAELQPAMAGPKTMIGDGIGLALKMFEGRDSKSKVVILLTDGNDTGSKMPVQKAASIAAQNAITIHTIAMGDPTTIGEAALDVDRLKEISGNTDGRFFLALDRQQLESVYSVLDKLVDEKIETVSFNPRKPLFHFFIMGLVLTFFLLALIFFVSARVR
jgi:Ca-activated chloride channel homolog